MSDNGPCQCIDFFMNSAVDWEPENDDRHCCLRDGTGNARDDWCHTVEWDAAS